MIAKVTIFFHYGGEWVFSPQLLYTKKLMHTWHEFDPDLLSYKDLCEEFNKELGYFKVKQLLVVGPSGRYYIVEGDDGIQTLQCLVFYEFKNIDLFVVDDTNLTVDTLNILYHLERYHVDVEVASDNEHVPEDSDVRLIFLLMWSMMKKGFSCLRNKERVL